MTAYRSGWRAAAWMSVGRGEQSSFLQRVCSAFLELIQGWQQKERRQFIGCGHGGTQMALLEQFGEPKRSYYEGQTQAGMVEVVGKTKGLDKGAAFVSQAAGKERKKMRIAAAFYAAFSWIYAGGSDWMRTGYLYGKSNQRAGKILAGGFGYQKGL